ncbi:MAG TPA: hypothetical protein VEW42_05835 [Candidatus Eisenbacteria bacterium]|nr:hypothetical protein [Candidatus Eisenbacteria bacterium]
MKKLWFLLLVVLLIVVAYFFRFQIKALFSPKAQVPTPTVAVSPTIATIPTSNIYVTKTDSEKGAYMADFAGMTLYTFDKDTQGVSNCYNACATAWPPYISGAEAQGSLPENITLVTRTDGSKQFAWRGMPLYYYAKDTKVGDITGDGVGGVWHIIKQ